MRVFAVDIGDSEIRTAFVDASGQVADAASAPTDWGELGAATVRQLLSVVADAVRGAPDTAAIGIAAPGPISAEGVVVAARPGRENWRGSALRRMVEESCGLPVVVGTDGQWVALAEQRYGAGQGSASLVGLLIGAAATGGLVVSGRLFAGAHGAAAEIGHVPVDTEGRPCHCGARGCLEAHVSAPALEERYREMTGRDLEAIAICDRADAGEVAAAALMRAVERELRAALQAVIAVADPDRVVLGGSVGVRLASRIGVLADTLASRRAFPNAVSVVRSRLGPTGILQGAAAGAVERLAQPRASVGRI